MKSFCKNSFRGLTKTEIDEDELFACIASVQATSPTPPSSSRFSGCSPPLRGCASWRFDALWGSRKRCRKCLSFLRSKPLSAIEQVSEERFEAALAAQREAWGAGRGALALSGEPQAESPRSVV